MRKLLLATVAALGATMGVATYADAQVVDNTDGQAYPTPGTVTVRLNGRFRWYGYVADNGNLRSTNYGTPGYSGVTSSAASGTAGAAGATTAQGINKVANYGFEEYGRLYPGFDGVAANGLKYGVSLEIRQDSNGAAGGGTFGSVSASNRTRSELYFRRSFGYIGTDRFGTIRVGSGDQPTSLYITGNFENFDDGGLNGDLPGFLVNGGAIAWPFLDGGNVYPVDKIVYLSPQFYGVDFGLSFSPSTASTGNDSQAGCAASSNSVVGVFIAPGVGAAGPGCDALSSTSTGDYARPRNQYEGLLRYRGTFGPVGLAATAAYVGSGRVLDNGVPGSAIDPQRQRLEDLSFGDFGVAVTYGGLTVGGHAMTGRWSGGNAATLLNRGQPNSTAALVGASYAIGPLIVGFHVLRDWYEGDRTTATNENQTTGALVGGAIRGGRRRDEGVAAGATYTLAPGVSLYASYIFEEAKQRGYNFVTGSTNLSATSTAAGNLHNKLDQQVFAIGTSFAW